MGNFAARLGAAACLALGAIVGPAQAATISTDTTTDELNADGDCSLREAIQAANLNAPVDGCDRGRSGERDTVKLKPKNYALTLASTDEDANADGDLDLLSGGPLTVRGVEKNGGTDIIQTGDDRVFDVVGGVADVTIEKTNLTGGDVTSFTAADARGASIRTSGVTAKLTLRRVSVENANARVGGALYVSNSARVRVLDSELSSNEALVTGGAIATANAAKVKIKGASLVGNSATSVSDTVDGGAISHSASSGGKLTVLDTSLALNALTGSGAGNGARGGGIYSNAPLTIKRSFFGANEAIAVTSGTLERGGGLYVAGGGAKVVNSTFFKNDAGDSIGLGGGVYVASSPTSLEFTTFAQNTATSGGDSISAPGGADLGHSVIDDSVFGTPCDGTVISTGFNVSEADDEDCVFAPSDAVDVGDVGLDNQADFNGGRTETVAIKKSSPARNFVPVRKCADAKGEDQRKFKRPAGKRCDAGAYERGAKAP